MPQLFQQFANSLLASGLPFAEQLDSFLRTIPPEHYPQDGDELARLLIAEKKLTSWQAQQIHSGKGQALVLGNYVVLDKLGQGGMGMVLRAEHRRMGRQVALKVLSPAIVESPEALRRFQREVQAAARLHHPNIVLAYDADEEAGTHFLVMEYVPGSDLTSLVRKNGVLSLDNAIHCILEAARGLEYAHGEGIIHRDIKPANLLLDAKGRVKILDMGLARLDSASGPQDELTGTGQIMGTVDYMAPEQAINTKSADARADIYSLGVTFWFLIAGRPMYSGETVIEKLMAHQTRGIPSLREQNDEVTPGVEAVFRKMVAKQPADRYQSMGEVIQALEHCRSGDDEELPFFPLAEDENSRFDFFLQQAAGAPAPSGKPGVSRVVTGTQFEETIASRPAQEGSSLDPVYPGETRVAGLTTPTKPLKAASLDQEWWQQPAIGITGALTALLVLSLLAWQGIAWWNRSAPPMVTPAVEQPPPAPAKTPFLESSRLAQKLNSPEYEWTMPENLGPTINTAARELCPALSDDECVIVFTRNGQVHEARRNRKEEAFRSAKPLDIRLAGLRESTSLSGDGLLLVLNANGPGGEDIYLCERSSLEAPFGAPMLFPEPVNTPRVDREAVISSDGLMLLVTTIREGTAISEIHLFQRKSRQDAFLSGVNLGKDVNTVGHMVPNFIHRDGLLLLTTLMAKPVYTLRHHERPSLDAAFGPGTPFGPPFDSNQAGRPWISPDGERMYFHSRDFGGRGELDLLMTRRVKKGTSNPPPPVAAAVDKPYQMFTASDYEWSNPESLGPAINSSEEDENPCLSADGLTLYFDSSRPGGKGLNDLWMVTPASHSHLWSAPQKLESVNSEDGDIGPAISADGLQLYFASTRGAPAQNWRLWSSSRVSKAAEWSAPELLPIIEEEGTSCASPALSYGGNLLMYHARRPGGTRDELRFCTRRSATDPWSSPAPVPLGAATDRSDKDPTISSDARILVFASTRGGEGSLLELWWTSRRDGNPATPWETPQPIGRTVNGSRPTYAPTLSSDGDTIYFATLGRSGGAGKSELWLSRRVRKK